MLNLSRGFSHMVEPEVARNLQSRVQSTKKNAMARVILAAVLATASALRSHPQVTTAVTFPQFETIGGSPTRQEAARRLMNAPSASPPFLSPPRPS